MREHRTRAIAPVWTTELPPSALPNAVNQLAKIGQATNDPDARDQAAYCRDRQAKAEDLQAARRPTISSIVRGRLTVLNCKPRGKV